METIFVTQEEMVNEIKNILKNENMALEQFIEEGKADTLTDGFHRDLWLYYRDLIIEL